MHNSTCLQLVARLDAVLADTNNAEPFCWLGHIFEYVGYVLWWFSHWSAEGRVAAGVATFARLALRYHTETRDQPNEPLTRTAHFYTVAAP